MDELYERFPCRKNQIDLLNQYLEDVPLPESLYIWGQPAVGKTSIIQQYLEFVGFKYAYINCVECYSQKLLHEQIISQMAVKDMDLKCENFMDLLHRLKLIISNYDEQCIIVLDGVEHLEELSENIFTIFRNLQEFLSKKNICVIFISNLLPEKFNLNTSIIDIRFPQYSKDELLEILRLTKPDQYSNTFYENYLNSALSIFLRMTRDLNEMKFLVLNNFEKYCEPINNGLINSEDIAALWRNILPQFKDSLKTVYSGISTQTVERYVFDPKKNEVVCSKGTSALDLPYYTKYLLISAYLASYNSPKHDRRLFMKNHGKQRKKLTKKQVKEKMTLELLGPKPFPLDRLLAIFYAIMDEKASLTVNLMIQISTLVELKLLARLGDFNLEKPKFKCLVGFDSIDSIAKTLGFEIKNYIL